MAVGAGVAVRKGDGDAVRTGVAVVFGGGVAVAFGGGVAFAGGVGVGVGAGVGVNDGSGRSVNEGLAPAVAAGDGDETGPLRSAGTNARAAPAAMSAPTASTSAMAMVLPSQFDGWRRAAGRGSGSWSIGSVGSRRSLTSPMVPCAQLRRRRGRAAGRAPIACRRR